MEINKARLAMVGLFLGIGSLKTGRRLARNVRAALFGRDKLHFAALDFQAADIAREQVAGYIAFGAA